MPTVCLGFAGLSSGTLQPVISPSTRACGGNVFAGCAEILLLSATGTFLESFDHIIEITAMGPRNTLCKAVCSMHHIFVPEIKITINHAGLAGNMAPRPSGTENITVTAFS